MDMRHLAQAGESMAVHAAAIVGGLVLMVGGIGMGVTIMLIPIAIPLGIVGFGLFLWGVAGWQRSRRAKQRPGP